MVLDFNPMTTKLRKRYNYLKKTIRLIGRIGCGLYLLNTLSSIALSAVEYAVAVFLMVFLYSLGFIGFSSLPGWLPFDVRTLGPAAIWGSLFLIMAGRGALQIINYQTRVLLTQRTQARLRMVLGYMIFMKEGTSQLPLSSINHYFSELFPKAFNFLFHFTKLSSFMVQALMISIGMFYFARGETLVGLTGIALMGLMVLRLNRYTHRTAKRIPKVAEDLERTKVRAVRNWLLIKILRTENEEYKRYARAVLQYYRDSSIAYLIANSGTSIVPICGVLVIALIVFANAHFFKTPGVHLVAFLYLFFRFQQMISHGSTILGDLFTCRVQFRESIDLASRLPAVELHAAFRPAKGLDLLSGRLDLDKYQPGPKRVRTADQPAAPPAIDIKDITFAWPSSAAPVLHHFSQTIPNGAQVGIIGPNGSGKSTLLAIITGVLKPDKGAVFIDGRPADEYLRDHSSRVSYVGPEPFLIQGTIRDNLVYACGESLSDEQLLKALEQVRLRSFVDALPEGLDYAIDENGAGLSSGQKQRLTIARALLRNPILMVMDEPTANIDNETEALLASALKAFKESCTIVIVSHKPAILNGADLILEIDPEKHAGMTHTAVTGHTQSASPHVAGQKGKESKRHQIPRLFHFVYGLKPQKEPFHLIHYLCIASCIKVNQPGKIFFYYQHEPYGRYWELIKEHLTLVPISPNPFVSSFAYENPLVKSYDYAHHSDFIRMEKLLALGGVYADIDTLFVNPIPERLYLQPFVLGKEPGVPCRRTGRLQPSLCNAFIMAEKDAAFGQIWLDQMTSAFDGTWSNHSTLLPYRLSCQYPELIHIEPQKTFYKHPWTKEGINTLFQGCDRDFDGVVSMHLWAHLWWSRKRRDFSRFHAGKMTEAYIRAVDTTYNVIARNYLPAEEKPGRLCSLREWFGGSSRKRLPFHEPS